MTYTTLHKIVTGLLSQRKYPIHFYADFLIYGVRVLEELHLDVLHNARVVKLDVNDFGEATLPIDFLDEISVSVEAGQSIRPMVHRRLNPLMNTVNGIQEPYSVEVGFYGMGDAALINDLGELTGRFYGLRSIPAESYSINKTRNIIQVDARSGKGSIYLNYISDGSEVDNATQINPYAKATIEDGILWKYASHKRGTSPGEVRGLEIVYLRRRKVLKARLNSLTINDIKSSFYQNSTGSPR